MVCGTMSAMSTSGSLRTFWSALPTEGRWLLSTVAVQTLGRGLTLPFTMIYLSKVRDISLGVSGLLMSLIAVFALAVTGPGGSLTDRLGARRMLLLATASQLVGCVVLAFATTPAAVAVAFLFIGLNFGVSWPAFNALVAAVVSGPARQQYFGINFALVNLGIVSAAWSAASSSTWIDRGPSPPSTWQTLPPCWCRSACCSARCGTCTAAPTARRSAGRRRLLPGHPPPAVGPVVDAAHLRRDLRRLRPDGGGMPAFASEVAEVSTRVIGFAFAVNTAVIVGLQFFVLGQITGKRRTRVFMVMSGLWGVSWLVLGAGGLVPGSVAASAMVLLFMALFALGETMLQPTVPAITNDLAPDHLRGRYNAVSAGAFQAGTILGPVVAGVLLQHHLSGAYVGLLVSGCLVMVWLARLLERRITPAVNGLATGAMEVAAPAPAAPSAAPALPGGASLADGQTPLA